MKLTGVQSQWASADPMRPKDLKDAASAFEGLLLGEMLKAAREGGEEGSASALQEHAESLLANQLSKSGGLGLASLITKQLNNQKEQAIGS